MSLAGQDSPPSGDGNDDTKPPSDTRGDQNPPADQPRSLPQTDEELKLPSLIASFPAPPFGGPTTAQEDEIKQADSQQSIPASNSACHHRRTPREIQMTCLPQALLIRMFTGTLALLLKLQKLQAL